MRISTNESIIFNSYEVKLFTKINLELLLIEKSLEFNPFKKTENLSKNELFNEKINSIWQNLNNLISIEKKEAEKNFYQADLQNLNEIIFILVSFIDEFFIHKDDLISNYWNKNLLEFHYFKSRNSGTLFFEKIDTILKSTQEQNKGLPFVYLLALNLGFKGQYFGAKNEKDILHYKNSLYSYIFNKSLNLFSKENKYYLSNIKEESKLDLNNSVSLIKYKKYYYFIIIFILIYTIYTTAFFFYKKSHLEKILNSLNSSMEFIIK